MSDSTEAIRRKMVKEINAVEGSREFLETQHAPRFYFNFKED